MIFSLVVMLLLVIFLKVVSSRVAHCELIERNARLSRGFVHESLRCLGEMDGVWCHRDALEMDLPLFCFAVLKTCPLGCPVLQDFQCPAAFVF